MTAPAAAPNPPAEKRGGGFLRWHRRVLAICLGIFALEIGAVLVIFPWRKDWDLNWAPLQSPLLAQIWMSPYFRGVLSGLGLLNLYIGLAELLRQLYAAFGRKK